MEGIWMVSVVIVTYNSLSFLPNCIESLERTSSAKVIELVLVDNASTDSTWEWITGYANSPHPSFVRVVTKRLPVNQGFAFACNRGVEVSVGREILFLNPDTIVGVDAVEICSRQLSLKGSLGAVGCRLELPSGKLDLACKRSFPTLWNSFTRFSYLSRLFPNSRWLSAYNLTYLNERGEYRVDSLCGAFLMVPRRIYWEIGGLDEDYFMYGEDIDLCKRIFTNGYSVYYLGTVTTVHVKGGNGGKKSSTSIRHFYEAMKIYFNKHYATRYPKIVTFLVHKAILMLQTIHLVTNSMRHRGVSVSSENRVARVG